MTEQEQPEREYRITEARLRRLQEIYGIASETCEEIRMTSSPPAPEPAKSIGVCDVSILQGACPSCPQYLTCRHPDKRGIVSDPQYDAALIRPLEEANRSLAAENIRLVQERDTLIQRTLEKILEDNEIEYWFWDGRKLYFKYFSGVRHPAPDVAYPLIKTLEPLRIQPPTTGSTTSLEEQQGTEAWAIKAPDGTIIRHTCAISEAGSIGGFTNDYPGLWSEQYAKGYRCIRIRIIPVEETASPAKGKEGKP